MSFKSWLTTLASESSLTRHNRRHSHRIAGRRAPRQLEILEDRTLLAAAFSEFVDPNPAVGNQFGHSVVAVSTGNVVITSPSDDFGSSNAGAVYLFNGATSALISTLRGSTANDNIGAGGVTAMSNGNYVVRSLVWDNGAVGNAGAVTFGNGTTGISGVVSAANSLVGATTNDQVGNQGGNQGVAALSNGNYVVLSPSWDNFPVHDTGAVTFGNGTTGVSGTIASANRAIGLTPGTNLQPVVVDNVNNTFFARFLNEGGGKMRVGSQFDGFANDPPTVPVDNNPAANSVLEGAANGVAVDVTAFSTDPGGQSITYSLTNNAGGRFAINSATGVLTVADSSLLDGPAMFTIGVQADDGAGGTSQASFNIAVSNVAPTATLTGNAAAVYGTSTSFQLTSAFDPSLTDLATLHYSFALSQAGLSDYAGGSTGTTYTFSTLLGVGTYTVWSRVLDKDGDFTDYHQDIIVTAAMLSVTAHHQTKVYGQADPALTYAESGFQFSDTASGVLTGGLDRAVGENVGGYSIGQGTLAASSNYVIAFTGDTHSISLPPR